MKTYEISFRNNSSRAQKVYDGEKTLATLQPGQTLNLECVNPRQIYSRFSSVVFTDGLPRVQTRKDWEEPGMSEDAVLVEILNIDGKALETLELSGRVFYLPKGIPIFIQVPKEDPLATSRRVEIKFGFSRKPSPHHPGYYETREILDTVFIPRESKS